MAEDELRILEAELRRPVPAGVAALDAEHLRHLTAAVREARHRQAAELEAAGEQALAHIPRLLRGPLRKALG
jgi:hypothetical protein